jgi:Rod binding domain-containing protein
MPTGYTSDIYAGRDITFRDFALGCARAFGALVTMRDDAKDAPIPSEFPEDTYHRDAMGRAAAALIDLDSLSPEACDTKAKAEYVRRLRDWRKSEADRAALRARYEAMLDEVLAWEPPTEEHVGLKSLMVEQLESSIQFDTDYESPRPVRLTGKQWAKAERKRLEHDVEYHGREDNKAAQRVAERNGWVKALFASLPAANPGYVRDAVPENDHSEMPS